MAKDNKLIMPKHLGKLAHFQAALKVYYDANGWVTMRDFADCLYAELKAAGEETQRNKDNTHYTKCAQLPRYFGFVTRKENKNDADAAITDSGKACYKALVNNDMAAVRKLFMEAMETLTFGRDTEGCGSDSDVEPLGVFFRAAYDLDGLTGNEYGYMLGRLHKSRSSLKEVEQEIVNFRRQKTPPPIEKQSMEDNLADSKTMVLLENIGFLRQNDSKRRVVTEDVDREYHDRLIQLAITNASLGKLFKKWLADRAQDANREEGPNCDYYRRSIEAISRPLSDPMKKDTSTWDGAFEYVTGSRPAKRVFEVDSRHDFDRVYRPFIHMLSYHICPKEIDSGKCEELWDYTLDTSDSQGIHDRRRMYNAFKNYKDFLLYFDQHKHEFGIPSTKEEIMENRYLAAIRTKPFILLTGISGTGKSRLVRQLAIGCCPADSPLVWEDAEKTLLAKKPGNFEMIPVRPNWHDSTQLLGYESRINGAPEFVVKPFVKFLAKAWLYEEEGIPFFFCLDEMNLAPVEQYFAEYLSVIETRKAVDGKIVTDPLVTFSSDAVLEEAFKEIYRGVDHGKAVKFIQKFKSEGGISIPQNFVVMGTVNMDETTFSFSRKVLDRAMSFELNEVEMESGLAENTDYEYGSIDLSSTKCAFTRGFEVYAAAKNDCDTIKDFLVRINEALDKTPFKIAYRTRDEIMIYCYERSKLGIPLAQALDEATSMKILSRIEGDKRRLGTLLESLRNTIKEGLKTVNGGAESKEGTVCSAKLDDMIDQLNFGYTSFWTR